MTRLTPESLEKLRGDIQAEQTVRQGKARATMTIHMGTCGIAAGARPVMTALLAEIEKRGIKDVFVGAAGCAGLCSREPMATVEIPGHAPVKYVDLNPEKIVRVLEEHVLRGNVVKEFALAAGSERVG